MNESISLSIIIPCHNAASTLEEQLSALAAQTWSQPWEVVFVDNRSIDNSRAIAESYIGKIPRLRIVDAYERLGQPYALNKGAQAALSESLAFADADDVVGEKYVEVMGEALQKNGFVACRFESEKLNPAWVKEYRRSKQENGIPLINYPPYLPHAGGGTLGVRKSLHAAVGGFSEALPYLHDTDFCFKIQLMGVPLHFVPETCMHIRFRTDLKGIFRQSMSYAEYNVILSKIYKDHAAPIVEPWRVFFWNWKNLVKAIPGLFTSNFSQKARWVWRFGWQFGLSLGSIKAGVPPV